MKAPARLGLYGLVLAAVFAVAFFTAGAIVPAETVQNWGEESASGHEELGEEGSGVAQGYRFTDLRAPEEVGAAGEMSVKVTGPDGMPVTDVEPGSEFRLIVMSVDGEHLRLNHPETDGDGAWSMPWKWDTPGTYRVLADLFPAGAETHVTLSTSVQVPGFDEDVNTHEEEGES